MPTTAQQPPQKTVDSLAWVDALRGIAILGVVLVHCFYDGLPWRMCGLKVTQWVLAGQYGVQLFFVASAFTLARSWHHRKTEHNPTRNYLLRRWFRIAPLYFAGVMVYTAIALLWHVGWNSASGCTLGNISANLLFVHGWVPSAINNIMPGGWSIGVEMSFYLLVPLLATRLHHPAAALAAFAGTIPLAGLCAWGIATASQGSFGWPIKVNSFLYFWLPTQLPVFIMGFFAYGLLKDARLQQWTPKRKRAASALLLVFSLLMYWGISLGMGKGVIAPEWLPTSLHPHFSWASPSLAGIVACALLLSLALHPWRLLVNRPTLFLGKLSFSLYVVHFIGAWMLAPWVRAHVPWAQSQPWGTLATFFVGVLACLAFSIPVAILTHRFIEKPGMALGKRLIERLEKHSTAE